MMLRITVGFLSFLLSAILFGAGSAAAADRSESGPPARRIPLTTSKVVGSPEPPLPYRVVRAYPKLKVSHPIAVAHLPGTDQMLLLGAGRSYGPTTLYRFRDDPAVEMLETVLELADTATDFTFHPRFAENGYVFIGSNGARKGEPKKTRVVRYVMERTPPYRLDPASARTIIEVVSDGHNGAAVAFGNDGMLYVTTGDGTSDSDTNVVGQDMTSLLAKVLRLDVDRPAPGQGYAVPPDNPFVGKKDIRPEIWAYGLRNPWRMTADRKSGQIWVAQNGQDLWEQAYLLQKGANYGWSVMEGSHPFYPRRKLGPTPLVLPTVEHHHSEARSLTGGVVYRGQRFPELQGAYVYGDYSTGRIWAVRHDGKKVVKHWEICSSRLAITGFGTDAKGEILVCDYRRDDAGLYRFEPIVPDPKAPPFPRTLSTSGLFRSVKGHVMKPALVPYAVNSVLWSDGAFKERWIAVPGEEKIGYTRKRGWNFPDGTVIVKSFGLEMEEGNPASRRWLETRFLTRQGGEWYGYSYAWNEEQTEGFLVESKGEDRPFTLRVPVSAEHPEGRRKQVWHFPSRAECMVCHSRAANWVLGLSEIQMNRDFDYGGKRENQLALLERLGFFEVNGGAESRTFLKEKAEGLGLKGKEVEAYVKEQLPMQGDRAKGKTHLLPAPPGELRRCVDPADEKADLTLRVRSYLHSNCASCHVEAGGGNAQMDLDFLVPLARMKVVDVPPVHDHFGVKDARLIAPGDPDRSILLRRIGHRDKGHMPPLATRHVDRQAVDLLTRWIRSLPLPESPGKKKAQ